MQAFLGSICIFGFNFAPYGWAFCNGSLMPISQNTALFSLIGTYYGGNGTTNFGLPNLQGHIANGQGQLTGGSSYVIGETSGSDSVSVLSSNMPVHTHNLALVLNADTAGPTTSNPNGAFPSQPSATTTKIYAGAAVSGKFMVNPTVTLGNSGGGQPMAIANPMLVMNYCIALGGIFPTRN